MTDVFPTILIPSSFVIGDVRIAIGQLQPFPFARADLEGMLDREAQKAGCR